MKNPEPRDIKPIKLASREKYQRLFSKDSGTFGMKAGHVALRPGENVGLHATGEREEAIIVLRGKGEALVGRDRVVKIKKNEVLYISPQTDHDIKNTSQGILEYVFVTSLAQGL